jgi:hypothetical protein
MKIGTLAKQNMLIECKSHKSGSLRQKTAKIKCKKNDIVLKKATLYQREFIEKQKLFIRLQKLPHSHNMCLGNRSLNFLINFMLWCMRVF